MDFTDRSSLESLKLACDEYIEHLVSSLSIYEEHDYTTKMQSTYYKESNATLKPDEVFVVCNFAENYSSLAGCCLTFSLE